MEHNRNLVAGILGLALSTGAWLVADTFPEQMAGSGTGAGFYPKILAVCIAVTSVCLIRTGFGASADARATAFPRLARIKFVLLLAAMGLYAFCIPRLG